MSAATAARLGTRVLALAALAGCGFGDRPFVPIGGVACPDGARRGVRAFIGPDMSAAVRCGGDALAPIASFDPLADVSSASFSLSLQGDPAFQAQMQRFDGCIANPLVVNVTFSPPATSPIDATFDAVATVHADDSSFPDGTVNLHGTVIAPTVNIDHPNIDFGDVAPDAVVTAPLAFTIPMGDKVVVQQVSPTSAPFSAASLDPPPGNVGPTSRWQIGFASPAPGDYTATLAWQGQLSMTPPAPCSWTGTTTVHARVVADGGASDAGATDSGADAPAEGP